MTESKEHIKQAQEMRRRHISYNKIAKRFNRSVAWAYYNCCYIREEA